MSRTIYPKIKELQCTLNSMMKIIVVDDHSLVRTGLCGLLAGQNDMEMVGSAKDGQAALNLINAGIDVDIVLTDVNMPGMDGIELTRQAIALQPNLRVIILSFHTQAVIKQRALAAGARDCLSKDGDLDDLLAAIRAVHAV